MLSGVSKYLGLLRKVMPVDLSANEGVSAADQHWPWWPLLTLGFVMHESV